MYGGGDYAFLGAGRLVRIMMAHHAILTYFISGINIFLDGFIPTENLRFRQSKLSFKMAETAEEFIIERSRQYEYPSMTKTLGGFKLTVEGGAFTDSEIIVMLGEERDGQDDSDQIVER